MKKRRVDFEFGLGQADSKLAAGPLKILARGLKGGKPTMICPLRRGGSNT